MTGRGKKAASPKKKALGYRMPAPIATGEVIQKKWRLGPSIGAGGFGVIYSACDYDSTPKGSVYPFVVKIEPHDNGPLFVEKNFYIRNVKVDDITSFMKSKKLSSLGMPSYYGCGLHDYKGEKYRYIVLERYGKDLWTLFTESGRSFPPATVFQIGLQMLDVLEYIQSRGYVHADIKGANILLGLKKGTENQAYLVDFGLATRVKDKEFKPDPKCAHNGTIEYTSRDAHLGVATMRGDLEILGYNMLQWLCGNLPWEKSLKAPKTVQEMKEAFMKSAKSGVAKLTDNVPDALMIFFEHINTLKPKQVPDYAKCRQIFETYLNSQGVTRNSELIFTPSKKTSKTSTKTISVDDSDDEKPLKKLPKKKIVKKRTPKPKEAENVENEEPNESETKKKAKRKSSDLSVLIDVKNSEMTPKATPPVKKNHANMATQTSTEKRRSVDSPIYEIIGEKRLLKISKENGSKKTSAVPKPKKKDKILLPNEENTEKRVIEKKVTTRKPKRRS